MTPPDFRRPPRHSAHIGGSGSGTSYVTPPDFRRPPRHSAHIGGSGSGTSYVGPPDFRRPPCHSAHIGGSRAGIPYVGLPDFRPIKKVGASPPTFLLVDSLCFSSLCFASLLEDPDRVCRLGLRMSAFPRGVRTRRKNKTQIKKTNTKQQQTVSNLCFVFGVCSHPPPKRDCWGLFRGLETRSPS